MRTGPHTFHAVYCYTPARWLYGGEYLGADRRKLALQPFWPLRSWDRRRDARICTSQSARTYGAESERIRPRGAGRLSARRPRSLPPTPRGERLLVVSRLLPYKRVDIIVEAATLAGIGLDVVGAGPALEDLRRMAGPTVTFHGRLDDDEVTGLMEGCRALCVPGKEDFGITPVEANAAGKPVVAFGAGGALETLVDGVTGSFFTGYEPDEILAAINRCERIDTTPEALAAAARRFSPRTFETALVDALHAGLEAHRR